MSIALLIQSNTDNGVLQTVIVPTNREVLTFHRLSTGLRGRASRWQTADLDTLPSAPTTYAPVSVVLSPKDVANAELGNITALSVKLLGIPTDSGIDPVPHNEQVAELVEALFSGDSELLNKFVSDNRRKNPMVFDPIGELTTAYFPAIAPVEEVKPVMAEPAPAPIPDPAPAKTSVAMPTELAKVPDSKWAETYLHRDVVSKVSEFAIYDVAMANHQNVIIEGPAGSGKTMSILAYASERGYRYYNVSANVGLEPSHLFGAWTPTETAGVFTWQDGPVTDLVRHGGVLLLNEIDFMPERITTVLFGLLDDRREIQLLERGGEVIKAHPNLLIVGDHNPNYRGSRPMNQAWKDRFAHKLSFGYDKSIERKLIKSKTLLEVADKLRQSHDKGEIDTPVSTRGLIAFVKNVENLGLDYALTSYVNGFGVDEREGVKLVLDTFKAGLGKDFGVEVKTSTKQADEDQN